MCVGVDTHGAGTVAGDQVGEEVAAGHQNQCGPAGQQRPDLRCRRGVVQEQQEFSVRDNRAVQPGSVVGVGRDSVGRNAQ